MKKILLVLVSFAVVMSCSRELSLDRTDIDVEQQAMVSTKSSAEIERGGAVFYSETSQWLVPQEDPFELSRFQRTFSRFASAMDKTTSVRSLLSPTHYALEVKPKTMEEQEALEQDHSLDVSYIPFGYILAPTVVPDSPNRVETTEIDIEDMDTISGEEPEIEPITLYIVWPADKEIPPAMDYKKLYDIFLPQHANLTKAEQEVAGAIRVYGDSIPTRILPEFQPIPDAILTIKIYDNFLSAYVPLKHAKIRAVFGSSTAYYTTDSLGKVTVSRMYGDHATCYYRLTQNKFTVRDSTSSAVVERSLGYVQIGDMSLPIYNNTYYTYNRAEDFPEMVYNAADYLYNEDTTTTPDLMNAPSINIYTLPEGPGFNGRYHPGGRFIEIRDNNKTARNYIIGTTLHEFGHYYQHYNWGYNDSSVDSLLTQSFAYGFGYYLGEEYYLSKGFVKPYNSYPINGQQRQGWQYTSRKTNSPLYVDLIDDYNQSPYGIDRPVDNLSGIPFEIILRSGKEAETLEDVESILNEDSSYNSSSIASQLVYYYYWRAHQ